MTTNAKMTKRDYFTTLRSIVETSGREDTAAILEFIDHEVDLLNRKSSKAGPTKTQIANQGVIANVEAVLRDMDHPVTISEMQADERLAGYSNQKISALLRQMKNANIVTKTVDKKKSYFSLTE